MQLDINTKDADFKTVPAKIKDEKAILLSKLDIARKEKDDTGWLMRDATDRYHVARAKFVEAEKKYKSNISLGKHWLLLGPTVI
jgi:hypothetical protein